MGSPLLKKVVVDAPPPQAQTYPLDQALASPQELMARAIGYSEGNRSLKGTFLDGYWGHTDPGNRVRNLGSFSVQTRNRQISTPAEADTFWLGELRRLVPMYRRAAEQRGVDADNIWIFLNVFDLYTQAPAAVVSRGGLLELLSPELMDTQKMINARVQSFYEPDGRLNAPGFSNNKGRLIADQTRRCQALLAWMEYNRKDD